jgi:hypothetical protein
MKTISEKVKAEARKAGKLPKAPKKPKQSASLATLERYKSRFDAYVKKVNDMAAKARKKESLKKTIFGY